MFASVNYGVAIASVGDLAWTSDQSKLYYWYQSGWGAGNAGTDVYEISVSGSTLAQSARSQIGYPNFLRDPLDTPMLVLEEQGVVIAKNRVLRRTNLNETVTSRWKPSMPLVLTVPSWWAKPASTMP